MPTLTRKEHIVVVDAYSGGRNLIPAFQALGFPVTHIQSGRIAYYARDIDLAAQRADRHLTFDGDVDQLVANLRPSAPRVVLAGSEGGVLLADQLAERLGVAYRNDIRTSTARRDKYEMHERIRKAGLTSVAQARVATTSELDSWLSSREGTYPVVIKPLRSAATDGLSVCWSRSAAHAALGRVLTRRDMFDNVNDAVLCQEFLVGDEYVINGVMCGDTYMCSEGWRSDKKDNAGSRVYDTQYLLYHGDPWFEELNVYVSEVCRAVGISNGAFHAEVMLTSNGPVLIEIAARPAGGADPYVIETCLGHSQIGLLVESALHPEKFADRRASREATNAFRRAAYVYLIATSSGRVQSVDLAPFLDIEGVVHVDYRYSPGDVQDVTCDLITAAGVVLVTADDQRTLQAAVQRVREVEAAMHASSVSSALVSDNESVSP